MTSTPGRTKVWPANWRRCHHRWGITTLPVEGSPGKRRVVPWAALCPLLLALSQVPLPLPLLLLLPQLLLQGIFPTH